MKKEKSTFLCGNCGYKSLKWAGKCPQCNEWNTFTEEITVEPVGRSKHRESALTGSGPRRLADIVTSTTARYTSGIAELDRALGGGFVFGSIILIGGDPGIGKSTLLLQAGAKCAKKVLYVSAEESEQQIKGRADRLGLSNDSLYLLCETSLEQILNRIEQQQPELVIIDSIQTIYKSGLDNSPGSVTQIRECTYTLMEETKRRGFTCVVVGHVTKEGMIAGPKVLEHIVDTVLYFEGDSSKVYRIIRAEKNRFGGAHEIGIFEMTGRGLAEVTNPGRLFLSDEMSDTPGTTVGAAIEGTRPLLIEVQALVTPSYYGAPQRVTTGFDQRRLSMLLAVLEKRGGLKLGASNVFLNIAGGVKIDETGIDLAVCTAIAGNLSDRTTISGTAVIGEVGLGGEIRSVPHIEKRVQEAEKLGFSRIIIPQKNIRTGAVTSSARLIGVATLQETIDKVLSQ